MIRALAMALVLAVVSGGCLVRYVIGPRLSGTCDGACAHYVGCRREPDRSGAVRAACEAECPTVFSDRDSLMAFESLACPDAVDFVEGSGRRPPGRAPATTTSSATD